MKKRITSFRHALNGLATALKRDLHIRLHLVATIVCVALALILGISTTEWFAILLAIGLVIVSELINTALEILCDKVSPDYDSAIGKIKDISAGAVLIAALIAAIIGIIVFLPRLFDLF